MGYLDSFAHSLTRVNTKDAKNQYDRNTGHIRLKGESCNKSCQGSMCKAYEEIWYFCKDK